MRPLGSPLTIAMIAPLRHPIRQPHAGGLEASIWDRVRTLRGRGHRVVLCAVEGSDYLAGGPDEFVLPATVWANPSDATDSTYPDGHLERALVALEGALEYVAAHTDEFDIVDNHCLHGPPLDAAPKLGIPVITTLHTPPLPAMLAANAFTGEPKSDFVAVSGHTAAEWGLAGIPARVVHNAIDVDRWALGRGGPDLVWFGRVVPEKGTHLAVQAARLAGRSLTIAGRIGDADYFADEIAPHLGNGIDYVGPLRQPELAALVGRSACALVTPMWEEPFGLVIAEALATGTPVAAFDTGGVAEVAAGSDACALVPMGDVESLAAAADALAVHAGSGRRRRRTREGIIRRFSLDRRAVELEDIFRAAIARAALVDPGAVRAAAIDPVDPAVVPA